MSISLSPLLLTIIVFVAFALPVLMIAILIQVGRAHRLSAESPTTVLNDMVVAETRETRSLVNDLRQRMALVQSANQNIRRLSDQVGGLERVLSDKSARGAFGESQMADILNSILPPHMLSFQQTLSNGKRVDCLLKFPGPPGAIAIDSKFPLESFQDYIAADTAEAKKDAAHKLERHVTVHLKDIAGRYIIPGETADQALMFLPSEAVFACLHADFRRLIDLSFRLKVQIVSPATCAAVLTTIRAVMRDTLLVENIGQVQVEIDALSGDLEILSDSLDAFDRHHSLLGQDLERMHKLTASLQTRAHRIDTASLSTNNASGGRNTKSAKALKTAMRPLIHTTAYRHRL